MSIIAQSQPSRQGYVSAVMLVAPGVAPSRAGEVQPSYFGCTGLIGSRPEWAGGRWLGTWLNVSVHYAKPGSRFPYHLEAAAFVSRGGRVQRVYVRSCSCPDGLLRRGKSGAARQCKHMVALGARLGAVQGVTKEPLLSEAWRFDQAQYSPEKLGY